MAVQGGDSVRLEVVKDRTLGRTGGTSRNRLGNEYRITVGVDFVVDITGGR